MLTQTQHRHSVNAYKMTYLLYTVKHYFIKMSVKQLGAESGASNMSNLTPNCVYK